MLIIGIYLIDNALSIHKPNYKRDIVSQIDTMIRHIPTPIFDVRNQSSVPYANRKHLFTGYPLLWDSTTQHTTVFTIMPTQQNRQIIQLKLRHEIESIPGEKELLLYEYMVEDHWLRLEEGRNTTLTTSIHAVSEHVGPSIDSMILGIQLHLDSAIPGVVTGVSIIELIPTTTDQYNFEFYDGIRYNYGGAIIKIE